MHYFATRRCDNPAVYEVTSEAMLKEHSRKFSTVSHWAFKDNEREKALKWAGVTTTTPGREDATYPVPVKEPIKEPVVPVKPEPVPVHVMPEPIPEPTPVIPDPPTQDILQHKFDGKNGLLLAFEEFSKAGYAFATIKMISGESYCVVLNDIVYWASNLIPTMFTPVYGGCDFRIRGSFNTANDWNNMDEVKALLTGNEGMDFAHILISSHRNLCKDDPNHGLFKKLPKARLVAMNSFVLVDHMYGSIERVHDKDLSHAMIGESETLTYIGHDDFFDHVINENLVVNIVPFRISESVTDNHIRTAFLKLRV